ncbi:Peptidase M23 [Sphingobium chlorophenolicum L-1]|uniref:Peptidase M23 n=1 Tax=Sphingobium chlorophenolicum L-1 TaxID=690566 RepID=F6F2I5_SPHCR|nr:M23 family metallopeptidase [Sphingobium chlorophenolicum]AEG50647.1 Peptidase M23 [Sphingobium chlorophenolicum L-1]
MRVIYARIGSACSAALLLLLQPNSVAASGRAAQDEQFGFGDDQFERLMLAWEEEPRRVPSLAAIYEADAPRQTIAEFDQSADGLDETGALSRNLLLRGPTNLLPSGSAAKPLAFLRITSAFGMRAHPLLGGMRNHQGIDLAAPMGTPVRATADGIVSRAGWSGGYGLLVALNHGQRMATRYGHMSRLAVQPGQRVLRNSIIGYVGSTGRSTGPHLHYEVLRNGRAVDPLN